MKVLIVGSGGREHAIAWSVSRSPKVEKIYCAPGNAGIAQLAECVDIGAMEFEKLADFAQENAVDLRCVRSPWTESIRTKKKCGDPGRLQGIFQRSYEEIQHPDCSI